MLRGGISYFNLILCVSSRSFLKLQSGVKRTKSLTISGMDPNTKALIIIKNRN